MVEQKERNKARLHVAHIFSNPMCTDYKKICPLCSLLLFPQQVSEVSLLLRWFSSCLSKPTKCLNTFAVTFQSWQEKNKQTKKKKQTNRMFLLHDDHLIRISTFRCKTKSELLVFNIYRNNCKLSGVIWNILTFWMMKPPKTACSCANPTLSSYFQKIQVLDLHTKIS